jgi:AcrR family transcriptional regulator
VAAALLAAKGYAQTGLDEIAERAGVTKGAVYSNFSSKADLALAVLDERELVPRLDIFSQVDADETFEDQHEHGGKLLVEAMDATSLWFQVELQCVLHAAQDPDLRHRMRAHDAALRSSLAASITERMKAAGWQPVADVERIVAALIAVSSGIALQRLKDPQNLPEGLAGQLIAAVYSTFARQDTAPSAKRKQRPRRAGGERRARAR